MPSPGRVSRNCRLSTGYLDEGLEAAERASALDSRLALTQTVKGYAYLMQIKLPQARESFDKAIDLDQAAPLPRLGLGLAKIRRGELKAGREDIETAVALDPGNSLMRSYMGKAYYDEKRDRLSGAQYEMAKSLDPKDPTPWFLDAIRKQTENRPVEALHDMQTSIALNDNRAVYRSRLQLDQDLATRSASQARIYNDLGFEQLALVKGWQSVNSDPSNYSAHRLLSDSYSALPRHEIARVSELLQSQLLQPINLTPVPPQLAEENLFILEGAGPANPAYLEFNPLFTRNRLALQADGLYGSNSTWGNDVVQNGVYDNWSWSAGQFHYESDGYRDNNDEKQNIYDLFVQGALSYRTSVQAELRHSDGKNGDLSQHFDPNDFDPSQREQNKFETARLGLHHLFNPGSEVIASFIYVHNNNDDLQTEIPVVSASLRNPAQQYRCAENPGPWLYDRDPAPLPGQLFQAGERCRLFHRGHEPQDHRGSSTWTPPSPVAPPIPAPISNTDENWDHKNAYVYANLPYGETLTMTAGASYEDLSHDRDIHNTTTVIGVPLPPTTNSTISRFQPRQIQSQAGPDLAGAGKHHAARRWISDRHPQLDHQPDDRTDPGGGIQPVLQRPARDQGHHLRPGRGPGDHRRPLRRSGIFLARSYGPVSKSPGRIRHDKLGRGRRTRLPVLDTHAAGGGQRRVPVRRLQARPVLHRRIPGHPGPDPAGTPDGQLLSSDRFISPGSGRRISTRRASSPAARDFCRMRRRPTRTTSSGWWMPRSATACRSATALSAPASATCSTRNSTSWIPIPSTRRSFRTGFSSPGSPCRSSVTGITRLRQHKLAM